MLIKMNLTPAAGLACLVLAAGGAAPASAAPASPSAARYLAANCANCHGQDGHSQTLIPSLAGRPAAELVGLLQALRSGERPATIMQQLAKGYSDNDIALLADYFAAQTAPVREVRR